MHRAGPSRREALVGLAAWAGSAAWVGLAGLATVARAAPPTRLPADPAEVLRVGPGRALPTPSAAARVAQAGAVVEIDAGNYEGDVAVWTQPALTLRAVGGPVRLHAAGRAAEGKAIWVLRGGRFDIEGIAFHGTRVAARNGAGIRLEQGQARLRHCRFIDNENGILTSNFRSVTLDLAHCEFGHNGHGDGQSHNLYAGAIGRLTASACWFHHARSGHLLKSRAAYNELRCNLLTDGDGGRASYELEFPSGGVAVVVGNVLEQAATTQNPHLVSYGVEGLGDTAHALVLAHNTLVNRRASGMFLRVSPGRVLLRTANNLLLGPGSPGPQLDDRALGNWTFAAQDAQAAPWAQAMPAAARGRAVALGDETVAGYAVLLRPDRQYLHPLQTMARADASDPGAVQAA